jgi:MFS family permease
VAGSEITILLRRPGYARYLSVVAASRATGTMFNVAGVLLVLEWTGSVVLAGITVAAATLPAAVSGPFLGAWLDLARSRRRLLVLDRAVTIAALAALLLLAGHAPNWVIPVIAVAYGVTSPLSAGAFSSMLPELAGPGLLDVANTFEASSINAAFIVGPALAGLIAGLTGAGAAIGVQMAVSALLIPLIAGDRIYELRPPHTRPARRFLATVSDGLRRMRGIPALRAHVIASVVSVAGWGVLVVGFPLYALSVDAKASASGYLWAAISLGSMVSAFVFRTRAQRLSANTLICCSFVAMGLSVALWPLVDGLAGALALVAFTGVLEGPSLVAVVAVRQRLAPPHLRGQIFATIFSLDLAASAGGSAAGGPIHAAWGTTAVLATFGVLMAASGLVVLWTAGDIDNRPTALLNHSAERTDEEQRGVGHT